MAGSGGRTASQSLESLVSQPAASPVILPGSKPNNQSGSKSAGQLVLLLIHSSAADYQ